MKSKQYLDEVKAIAIKVGNTYTLSGDIGKFSKGENVTVAKVNPSGNDLIITLKNDSGVTDSFYVDRDDDFEDLS